MKTETLSSISQRTGLSITTISRVLNGSADKYRISKKTCELIRQEAQRCNYLPGSYAQYLRKDKSMMIGLLLPSLSNPFFADIASTIIKELDKLGYTTMIIDTQENERTLMESARDLIARQVDGMIVVPCGNDPTELELLNMKVPIVLIDRYFTDTSLSYVTTNNYQAALDATRHIISKGHKSITCIQGVTSSMPNKQRVNGFLAAMKEAGLEKKGMIVGNDFSIRNGYLESKMILNSSRRPSAIFCLSGTILLGTLKAIREAGLIIPDEIAVISFDDNQHLDFFTPSIARMSQPTADMSALAAKILVEKINRTNDVKTQIMLTPGFIPGGSL